MPLSHSDSTLMPLSQFEPHSLPVFGQAQLMNRFVGGNVRVTVTWVAGHRHHTSFKSFNSYLGSTQGHLCLALATCTAEVRGANAVDEPCGCRPVFQTQTFERCFKFAWNAKIIKRDQNFSGFGLSVKALMRRSMVSLATVCRHVSIFFSGENPKALEGYPSGRPGNSAFCKTKICKLNQTLQNLQLLLQAFFFELSGFQKIFCEFPALI